MNTPELAELVHQDTTDGIAQQVVGAVIAHNNRILLLQRPTGDFRGGTWELPSGKVDPGDGDLFTALHRGVHEETGLTITEITNYLGAFDYTSGSGKRTRQHTWTAATAPAEVRLTEHDNFAWTPHVENYPVSVEVQKLIDAHYAVASNRWISERFAARDCP